MTEDLPYAKMLLSQWIQKMRIDVYSLSFHEIVSLFTGTAPPEIRERTQRFLDRYGTYFEGLLDLPNVKKLKAFIQSGFSPLLTHRDLGRNPVPYSRIPKEYSRWLHSKYVGAIGVAAAMWMNLSNEEALIMAAAGILHDVGHITMCHTMERSIRAHDQSWCHEENTSRIMTSDKDLLRYLLGNNISPDKVLHAIKERDRLGGLQRILDTVGYCFIDPLVIDFYGQDVTEAGVVLVASLLQSLVDIEPNGVLVLTDSEPLQRVLTRRALLYRDNFICAQSERSQFALNAIVGYLLSTGILATVDIRDITSDNDFFNQMRVLIGSVQDEETRAWLFDLLETPECNSAGRWTKISFRTLDEFSNWTHSESPLMMHRNLVVPRRPMKEIIKTCTVRIDGKPVKVGPHSSVIKEISDNVVVVYQWKR